MSTHNPTETSRSTTGSAGRFRPPAVPLVAHDPYFSIWSCADRLTDDTTRHWTGTVHPLTALVRIDGRAYRLMGAEPAEIPALEQVGLAVLPTRTVYEFQGGGCRLALTFLTPGLPSDIDALTRPITYLTWEARALDGRTHAVAIYFSAGAQIAVHSVDQHVFWETNVVDNLTALRIGAAAQPVLVAAGDDRRIDWGYLYAAAPAAQATAANGSGARAIESFVLSGELPTDADVRMPRAVEDDTPVAAFVFDLGQVGAEAVSRMLILAYDEVWAIDYLGTYLRPFWRRSGAEPADLLQTAYADYPRLEQTCRAFDDRLMADLTRAGGPEYASVAALAYRQTLAGNGFAAADDGELMVFPKENTSNGCVGTVDVIYPMAPMFLLLSPELTKGVLTPVLRYAESPRWRFAFAPHDLGCYPLATGQVYGGGEATEEDQMPVEECGNMLLLLAAIACVDGNPEFASRYWPDVTRWAEYLAARGFDPENQLCTDDFTGHLAHNTNLSVKAIEGIGAYALLCEMRNDRRAAADYRQMAISMARRWTDEAADGDHFRLAFDRPGTWSQKYNLVWDRILGLNLFPPEIARREITFYKAHMNRFGLPLDSRHDYSKTDWTIWSATLAENDDDFAAIFAPTFDFVNATGDRVPLSDFYSTEDAHDVGMHARPVMGGAFIKMLADRDTWARWVARAATETGPTA